MPLDRNVFTPPVSPIKNINLENGDMVISKQLYVPELLSKKIDSEGPFIYQVYTTKTGKQKLCILGGTHSGDNKKFSFEIDDDFEYIFRLQKDENICNELNTSIKFTYKDSPRSEMLQNTDECEYIKLDIPEIILNLIKFINYSIPIDKKRLKKTIRKVFDLYSIVVQTINQCNNRISRVNILDFEISEDLINLKSLLFSDSISLLEKNDQTDEYKIPYKIPEIFLLLQNNKKDTYNKISEIFLHPVNKILINLIEILEDIKARMSDIEINKNLELVDIEEGKIEELKQRKSEQDNIGIEDLRYAYNELAILKDLLVVLEGDGNSNTTEGGGNTIDDELKGKLENMLDFESKMYSSLTKKLKKNKNKEDIEHINKDIEIKGKKINILYRILNDKCPNESCKEYINLFIEHINGDIDPKGKKINILYRILNGRCPNESCKEYVNTEIENLNQQIKDLKKEIEKPEIREDLKQHQKDSEKLETQLEIKIKLINNIKQQLNDEFKKYVNLPLWELPNEIVNILKNKGRTIQLLLEYAVEVCRLVCEVDGQEGYVSLVDYIGNSTIDQVMTGGKWKKSARKRKTRKRKTRKRTARKTITKNKRVHKKNKLTKKRYTKK